MEQSWDERYANPNFIYGIEPNLYFEKKINTIFPKGNILLPAEGEGRNAVYAALTGWNVTAFDSSTVAKHKALNFALEKNVRIEYQTFGVEDSNYQSMSFDSIALIYTHFPEQVRAPFFKKIVSWLKP
ncbi:MAG: class I SAM-dependent methyltransferase [Bacteroidota bacterium]